MLSAVSNLVRTGLTKSTKDTSSSSQQQQQQQIQLKIPQDSTKLEKQIKSLISKLENGSNIISSVYKKKGNFT